MTEKNLFIIQQSQIFINMNKQYCYIFKYLIIVTIIIYKVIILLNYNKYLNKKKKNEIIKKIKVCLCTLGKNENKYIKEFVMYYKKFGVDKIFLYDNNDIDGEKFEEVIYDFINKGFVEIKNWRGVEKAQFNIMNNCYQNNYNKYDWLIFYDIDEFIYLKNYNNIKLFLNESKFTNCGKIELNWLHLKNDNLIYYDNRPLSIRFNEKELNVINNNSNYHPQIKSILRGHIPNIHISCLHRLTSQVEACDGHGRKSLVVGIKTMDPDYENYYIIHYFGKSLEEFIEKAKKGSAAIGKNNISIMAKINRYFEIYNYNKEKIDYIEKETGMNLSKYKLNLK